MNLNKAYDLYKENPDANREAFGAALLDFCKRFQRTSLKEKNGDTAVSSWYSTDDAVNDSILDIWEHLDSFDRTKGRTFVSWVRLVLERDIKDSFKKVNRHGEVALNETALSHEPHRNIEDKLTLKSLLSRLSKEDKAFVKLKLEGYSEEELDKYFGKRERWSHDKWEYLKKKLRQMAS